MAETEGENLDHPSVLLPASVISDDKADRYDQIPTNRRKEVQQENMDQAPDRETTIMDFHLDGPQRSKQATAPTLVEDEEDDVRMSKKPTVAEFLRWHHRLNHIPMNKMQKMLARLGLLPKLLARCKVPACTSCLYGEVTCRPWRTKPRK